MHYTCRFFSSTNTPDLFSRYWENEPDNQVIFSKRGHLFGILTIKNPQPDNAGSQIISQINQTYFSQTDQGFELHLQETLKKINDLWQDQSPSILLVAINQGRLATVSVGQSQLFLKRQSNYSLILANPSDPSTQVNFVSGPIENSDLLFLTDSEFSQKLPNLEEFFSKPDLNQQEDYVRANINSFPSSSVLVQIDRPSVIASAQPNISKPPLAFLSKIIPKKPITISRQRTKTAKRNKKINLILLSLSFIGLSVSIYIGYQKNQLNQRQQRFADIETRIVQNLDSIDKVRQLNLGDALILAQQTKDLVDQMALLSLNTDQVSQYQSQVDDILSQTGSTEASNLEYFYDTSLIANHPSYSQIIFDQDKLYLLDKDNLRIDSLTITNTPSNQSISQSDQTKKTLQLVSFKSDIYAMTQDALYLVQKTNWTKSVDLQDLNIISVKSWGSSIYFLSPSSIYKSSLVNNVLTSPVVWLKEGQSLPNNSIDLAIDSQIWVLSKQAGLSLFLRGAQDNFKLSQPPQTDSAFALSVAVDSDLIIFLPTSNSLMVYDKQGLLISNYNFDNKNILSAVLDESTQTVYLLSADQKIYRLSL